MIDESTLDELYGIQLQLVRITSHRNYDPTDTLTVHERSVVLVYSPQPPTSLL